MITQLELEKCAYSDICMHCSYGPYRLLTASDLLMFQMDYVYSIHLSAVTKSAKWIRSTSGRPVLGTEFLVVKNSNILDEKAEGKIWCFDQDTYEISVINLSIQIFRATVLWHTDRFEIVVNFCVLGIEIFLTKHMVRTSVWKIGRTKFVHAYEGRQLFKESD